MLLLASSVILLYLEIAPTIYIKIIQIHEIYRQCLHYSIIVIICYFVSPGRAATDLLWRAAAATGMLALIGFFGSASTFYVDQGGTSRDPAENALIFIAMLFLILAHMRGLKQIHKFILCVQIGATHQLLLNFRTGRPDTIIHTAEIGNGFSGYIYILGSTTTPSYTTLRPRFLNPMFIRPVRSHGLYISMLILLYTGLTYSYPPNHFVPRYTHYMLIFMLAMLPPYTYILYGVIALIVCQRFDIPAVYSYLLCSFLTYPKNMHVLLAFLFCYGFYTKIIFKHELLVDEQGFEYTAFLALGGASYGPYVGGDFELLHFYPRNGQTGYYRSGHIMINYITVGQYGLWFTFIFLINVYSTMLFRSVNIRRADIRGRRAVGDKRRGAGPELLTCFFPLLGCFNILNNSLSILNNIETNGSYAALTMQVTGFQGGGRYSYGELNYARLMLSPIRVGHGATIRYGKGTGTTDTTAYDVLEAQMYRKGLFYTNDLPTVFHEVIKAPIYKHGLIVTSQGTGVTPTVTRRFADGHSEFVTDPLRLFRATGIMALPTRALIRLLATAEDVTHSGALPALGLKLDCVPGRLFVSFLNINREGVYYGQCSELCGGNHYNMPIILYALPLDHFIVGGEVELHSLLLKKISSTQQHYKLLNLKYK